MYFEMTGSLIRNAKETQSKKEEITDQLHDISKRYDEQIKHMDEKEVLS